MSSIRRTEEYTAPPPARIRILHVVETMLGMGGMEKCLINLTRTLPSERFEHVVCVIRTLGPLADTLPREVTLTCPARIHSRFQAGMLARLIREVNPDVVHSRNWGAIETVFAARWVGTAGVVHSEHGLEIGNTGSDPLRRRILRRAAFELADSVFCVSDDLRRLHERRTGFLSDRMGVIHNGVDTGRFRHDASLRTDARQHFGIRTDDFCIGAVGRLEPVKDIPTLLRAAERFAAVTDRWCLLIAGDGSERQALEAYAGARPKLARHVRFVGDIDEVPKFLNALDVYVISSLFEGICNSLLEAMATGIPAVVTAAGGNLEVITDGNAGMLFPPGDDEALAARLQQLWRDAALRSRLGETALERAHGDFSLRSMTARYERLYTDAAVKRQRAAIRDSHIRDKGDTRQAF